MEVGEEGDYIYIPISTLVCKKISKLPFITGTGVL